MYIHARCFKLPWLQQYADQHMDKTKMPTHTHTQSPGKLATGYKQPSRQRTSQAQKVQKGTRRETNVPGAFEFEVIRQAKS